MQIESRLQDRQGGAVTNFLDRLPPPQSDLARDTLKDPYIFDFLGLTESAQERDIETALTQHITRFLLELGAGFAFSSQGSTGLTSAVMSSSSICCLPPEAALLRCGRTEGYAVQTRIRWPAQLLSLRCRCPGKAPDDQPTIGLLLCKENNRLVAEYALRGIAKPISVAEYQLLREVPPPLAPDLPSIAQIEAELGSDT
jgi:YhcG PDDEXK nuclease domain